MCVCVCVQMSMLGVPLPRGVRHAPDFKWKHTSMLAAAYVLCTSVVGQGVNLDHM